MMRPGRNESSSGRGREAAAPQAGFTLVEAMIAIVMLVFGLMAITNLFLVAGTSNTVANHMTATASDASETMDLLKAIPYQNLCVGGDLNSDLPSVNTTGTITDPTTGKLVKF